MTVSSFFKNVIPAIVIAGGISNSAIADDLIVQPKSAANSHEFTLANGQKCFVASSNITFCTDDKGAYRPEHRKGIPSLDHAY